MKGISKVISLSLIFSLLLTSLSISKASAESINLDYSEEDVEELANLLEVLFEESMVYDNNGSPIGFDKEVLNEKVLTTEYSSLIDDFEEQGLIIDSSDEITESVMSNEFEVMAKSRSKRDLFLDKCIAGKLNDSYGVAAVSVIITAIHQKQWKIAANRLIRMGVKAAPPVIIANLGWILGSCIYAADKKGL